jgi:hypothetical protein
MRFIYFKRWLFKPRSLVLKFCFVSFLCYLTFFLGLLTHLFEKDMKTQFEHPVKLDIKLALQSYMENIDSIKYLENPEFNYSFLHRAERLCSAKKDSKYAGSDPHLIILVKSKINNFERRETIRKTWGQLDRKTRIRTVFLTGVPSLEDENQESKLDTQKAEKTLNNINLDELDSQLKIEYAKYGDLVQQDFHDVYYNNTLKTFMGIRWIVENCPQSKFYLFIDDDFYLNPNLLMKYLSNNVTESMRETLYAGFVFNNSSPMRHMLSKWYISLNDYPYHKFPPYVSAGCFVLSYQSAKLFYIGSKIIQKFKFDDIYMGIVAYKLGIKPQHIYNVYYYAPTYFPSLYATDVIASHGFNSKEITQMWNQLEYFIKYDPK